MIPGRIYTLFSTYNDHLWSLAIDRDLPNILLRRHASLWKRSSTTVPAKISTGYGIDGPPWFTTDPYRKLGPTQQSASRQSSRHILGAKDIPDLKVSYRLFPFKIAFKFWWTVRRVHVDLFELKSRSISMTFLVCRCWKISVVCFAFAQVCFPFKHPLLTPMKPKFLYLFNLKLLLIVSDGFESQQQWFWRGKGRGAVRPQPWINPGSPSQDTC